MSHSNDLAVGRGTEAFVKEVYMSEVKLYQKQLVSEFPSPKSPELMLINFSKYQRLARVVECEFLFNLVAPR